MSERADMEVMKFAASLASRTDGHIVIALFDCGFSECVVILKCSEDAARGLVKAVSSALPDGTS